MLRARPRVHARDCSICRYETDKNGCRSVLNAAPADGIIAAHCGRTEIRHFRLKGRLRVRITSLFVAKEEQKRDPAKLAQPLHKGGDPCASDPTPYQGARAPLRARG